MPRAAAMPSLIDDADFLAEIDKLEAVPAPPVALHAFWDQASGVDEAGKGRSPAIMRAPPGPAPELPQVRRTRSAKPVRPVQPEKPLTLETPSRIEMPFQPEMPARPERPLQPKRPVRPVHVDEVGEPGQTWETTDVSETRRVSASLAALTVVLCFAAGAGSAALVFHDRVAQVAVTWKT